MSTDLAPANWPSIVSVLYSPLANCASVEITPVTSLPSTSTRNCVGPAAGSLAPDSRILSEPSAVGAAGAATAVVLVAAAGALFAPAGGGGTGARRGGGGAAGLG